MQASEVQDSKAVADIKRLVAHRKFKRWLTALVLEGLEGRNTGVGSLEDLHRKWLREPEQHTVRKIQHKISEAGLSIEEFTEFEKFEANVAAGVTALLDCFRPNRFQL